MRRPVISTARTVEVFEKMVRVRRLYCADSEFFKMSDVWKYLSEGDDGFTIKTYRSGVGEDYKRRAGVIALGSRVTLSVDEVLLKNADNGCLLSNFILAHELGHLELDHHAQSKVIKNFQLFSGPHGASNLPPTLEELEANYAAVFFQCGVALLDGTWDPVRLARRAFSDVHYIKNAQSILRLDGFVRVLNRPRPKLERLVL